MELYDNTIGLVTYIFYIYFIIFIQPYLLPQLQLKKYFPHERNNGNKSLQSNDGVMSSKCTIQILWS